MSILVHYLLKREPEILRDDVFADNILQIEFEFVVFHFLIQCIVFENPLKKKHKSIYFIRLMIILVNFFRIVRLMNVVHRLIRLYVESRV